jgi:hypothetical protein
MSRELIYHLRNEKTRITIAGILSEGEITLGASKRFTGDAKLPPDKDLRKRGNSVALDRAKIAHCGKIKVPADRMEKPGTFFNEVAKQMAEEWIKSVKPSFMPEKKKNAETEKRGVLQH